MLDKPSKRELYVKERTDHGYFEDKFGFIEWRYLDNGKTVYIIDIFVEQEYRKDGHAARLADKICKEAKEKGATCVLGTVVPSAKGSTESIKVLMAYGMTLHNAQNDCIIFRKEI